MADFEQPELPKRLALRLDDVGAASKQHEVYSKWRWQCGPLRLDGNWLFLKYLSSLRAWGVYREMSGDEWRAVFLLLEAFDARLTVAVTATWVDNATRLIPYPEKFPTAAAVLKEGLEQGLIEIANHGLIHCVLKSNAFKPKWFSSNRTFHREFWDWVPPEIHAEHLRRSQDILQTFFQTEVVTFVPPGNVFTAETVTLAHAEGLRYLSCNTERRDESGMRILGNEDTLAFHDREIVLDGVSWLRQQLDANKRRRFCTVRELAEGLG